MSTALGRDLVLERTFRAPIDDVWASITEPERTARWLGPWKGEGAPGGTVELPMSAEDGAPAAAVRIDACEPPRHLRVLMDDAAGTWRLEADLTESDGITTLRLTHHLDDSADPASTGPGWEYYLDPPSGGARRHGDAGVGRVGPVRGLRYVERAIGAPHLADCLPAKLLGSYERELPRDRAGHPRRLLDDRERPRRRPLVRDRARPSDAGGARARVRGR